jgi:phosphoglycolate phosphatase
MVNSHRPDGAVALRATLLDLDGTLLDTAPDLAFAANRAREAFGLPDLPTPRVALFVGKGTDVLVQRAITDRLEGRLEPADFARAKALFEDHYRSVNGTRSRVFDRVPEALAQLRAAGLLLACVTNKPREFTLPLLERSGLLPHLDAVACGDEVARRKPYPDLVLAVCARLQVPAQAAILIGDSANDAQAAHAAGASTVLVETGYNEGESVHDLAGTGGVNGIFPTLFDAAQWILAQPRQAPATHLRGPEAAGRPAQRNPLP